MGKSYLKKGLVYILVLSLLFSGIPWQVVSVFADETTTSSSSNHEPIEEKEKVTLEDLPEETQKKLEEVSASEEIPNEPDKEESEELIDSKEEIQESFSISQALLSDFSEKKTTIVSQLKEEQFDSGKEEVVEERTEYSKTFIDPKTEIGETILFTSPVHEKDQQGNWQEIQATVKEADQTIQLVDEATVTIPKEVTEESAIQVTDIETPFELSLLHDRYEVVATNENHVLLQSEKENEPIEISVNQGITEFSQYVDTQTNLEELDFKLNLSDGQTARFNQEVGGIELCKEDNIETIIPYPTLVSVDDQVITPLTFSYEEETGIIHIKSIKKESLEQVGKAKISLRAVLKTDVTVKGLTSTSIRQYDDKMSYAFQNYMMVGYDNGFSSGDEGAAHFQTYGIVNIPSEPFDEISRTHEIMSATLKVKRIGQVGFWGDTAKDSNGKIVSRLFEAAPLTKDVGAFSTLTYDKFISKLGSPYGAPSNEDGKETKLAGLEPNNRWVGFDITNTANDWKNGIKNYGLLLKNNKMSSHEMPYSQAEVFGSNGYANAEPYVILTHQERPPIDKNMPLKDTTLQLRPFVQSDNDGLLQFSALGLDGTGRPEAEITYRIKDANDDNKIVYTGKESSIGREYIYPNYPILYNNAQKYLELSSNWQTNDLLTTVLKENHLYQAEATITYTKNGKNESAEKKYDTFQLYKVSSQDTLSRLLSFYGLEKNRVSFMRDNNMKDELLSQGNFVFIRNPKKNAGKAYTAKPLTNAEKIRLDSLAMGRGKHCQFGFEPINIGSGNFLYDITDNTWFVGETEESFTRTYNAMGLGQDSPIGRNWTVNQMLQLNQLADKGMMFTLADGGKVFFTRKSDGSYQVEDVLPYTLKKSKEIVDKVEKRLFILEDTSQRYTYTFDATGQIRSIKNAYGQEKKYIYETETGLLKEISLFNDKTLSFKWNSDGHLTEIVFPDGTKNNYSYSDGGDLIKATDSSGAIFTYVYDNQHRMTSYAGNDGKDIYKNEYDTQNRVIKQTDAEGNVVMLAYGEGSVTTTDGNGVKTVSTFNDHYQPTKTVYEDGSTEVNSYNENNQLVESVNRKGESTTYTYDAHGNLTSTSYPDGTKEITTYNQSGLPLIETNRQGNTVTHEYDKQGNEIKVIDESGYTTVYTYSKQGEKLTETNAMGQTITYTYENGWLKSANDEQGLMYAYTYDTRGLLATETDGNGKTKSYIRNTRGEVIKETNYNGAVKTYAYDTEGNKISETDYNGNVTLYTYNKIGKLVTETNPAGGIKSYKYDGNGNVIEESDYLGNVTKMTYNSMNQKISLTLPNGSRTSYEYDILGNLTKQVSPNGDTIKYVYDLNGYLIKETNSQGHETVYERNIFGLPTRIIYPNMTEELYTYDAQGNMLTHQAQNGQLTSYKYNAKRETITVTIGKRITNQKTNSRGAVIEVTNPLNQTVKTNYNTSGYVKEIIEVDGTVISFELDGEGNILKEIAADGVVSQYNYDGNGNRIKEISPEGQITVYTYNRLNLLEAVQYPTGEIEQYYYDSNGNMVKKIDPLGYETAYQYTSNNELSQTTDALGNSSLFTYDKNGNVATYTDTLDRVTTYQYNGLNQLVEETTSTGLSTTYSYNKAGQLVRMEDSANRLETYTYDAVGNLTSITDSLGRKELFAYNEYGNKISETDILGNQTKYIYDELGQCIKKILPQGSEETTVYDSRNRVKQVTNPNSSVVTYEYDAVGQLIKEINAEDKSKVYEYDKNRQLTRIIDENENSTSITYDDLGRAIQTVDSTGTILTQHYDGNGNVISEIDGEGNETTYGYDQLNQLVEVVDAQGFKETTFYDAVGRTIQTTDFNGNIQNYTYDDADNLIETMDALKRKKSFSYDVRNQLIQSVDAIGASTKYTYNVDGTVASEENAKGYLLTYTYDEFSQLVKTTDTIHEDALYEYTYDNYGQLVKETRSGSQTTEMSYDLVGRLVQMSYPNETKIHYTYDEFDRVETMIDARGNETKIVYDNVGNITELIAPNDAHTTYTYDGNNNLLKTTDPLKFVESFTYNKNNQVVETTDAIGSVTKKSYTSRLELSSQTDARGNKQSFFYDGNGNQTEVVDGKENSTKFSYDNVNRLIRTTNRLDKVTEYGYDAQDNLTSIKDANNGITKFNYSLVGELEEQISANGKVESYSYRLDGQLEETTKANGETITYSYDELNRMIGKQLNNEDFIYAYDKNDELVQAEISTDFDLSELDNEVLQEKIPNSHNLTFERNEHGDILTAVTDTDETIRYTYDKYGRQTSITYPNGEVIEYKYDKKNQLIEIINGDTTASYQYDGMGQIKEINHGDGTKSSYRYLTTGEIAESVTSQSNGEILSKQVYDYDENGNLIQETLDYPKFSLVKTYEYDIEDQVIQVTEEEKGTVRVTKYIYDNVGNRLASSLEVNGKSKSYQEWTQTSDNELISVTGDQDASYEYDKNGHVSKKICVTGEVFSYIYDSEGRLIQESSNFGRQTYYYYDALGNRVTKATGKETDRKLKTDLMEWMKGCDREAQLRLVPEDITLEEALKAVKELKCLPVKDRTWIIDHTKNRREVVEEKQKKAIPANTTLEVVHYVNDYTQEYVSPLQQTSSIYEKKKKKTTEATLFYNQRGTIVGDDLDTYHQDGLGSLQTQTQKVDGTLYSNNLYQAYGRSERPIYDQVGYRSQYHEDWKKQHLRAREYDTTVGRFQQLDTVTGDVSDPLTQHKYIYAKNNPLKYRDDAGRASWLSKTWNSVKRKLIGQPVRKIGQSVAKKLRQTVNTVMRKVVPPYYRIFREAHAALRSTGISKKMKAGIGTVGVSYNQNSSTMAGARVVWYGNQPYNLNDPEQYKNYSKKTNIDYTTRRAAYQIKKLCEQAEKIYTQREQQVKYLESTLGKANSQGQYYFPAMSGGGIWMDLDEARAYINEDSKRKKQVIGVAGIGLLTILALFPPAAALPGFSVTATSGGELALSTGGVLANGAIASVAGTISIAGIAGSGSGDGEGASGSQEKENKEFKTKKKTKGKKKDDIPERFKGEKPYKGESGKDAAKRVLEKYGEYDPKDTGPKSVFNQLKKHFDHDFE